MKGAAIDYLKSTNWNCTIVSDKEVERMGWEFQYHCEAKTEQERKEDERRDRSGILLTAPECLLVAILGPLKMSDLVRKT